MKYLWLRQNLFSEHCRNISKWCDHDTVEIFLEKTLSKPLFAKQCIHQRERKLKPAFALKASKVFDVSFKRSLVFVCI